MRRLLAVLLAACFLTAPAPVEARVPAGTVLLLSHFDTWDNRWIVEDGKSTAWVANGQLALGLEMTTDGWVRQARVETSPSFLFTYGTMRARMRFTGLKGAHPSFWAQDEFGPYCNDRCAEIDAVEHFGAPRVQQGLHWCPCPNWPATQQRQQGTDLDPAAWHYYKVDWSPAGYVFSVDGTQTAAWFDVKADLPHYLVLSYLIADWERVDLQRDRLGQYRAYVDFVEFKANAYTRVGGL